MTETKDSQTPRLSVGVKSDEYQAFLRRLHPPILIRFNDGRSVTVPFSQLDEVLKRRK